LWLLLCLKWCWLKKVILFKSFKPGIFSRKLWLVLSFNLCIHTSQLIQACYLTNSLGSYCLLAIKLFTAMHRVRDLLKFFKHVVDRRSVSVHLDVSSDAERRNQNIKFALENLLLAFVRVVDLFQLVLQLFMLIWHGFSFFLKQFSQLFVEVSQSLGLLCLPFEIIIYILDSQVQLLNNLDVVRPLSLKALDQLLHVFHSGLACLLWLLVLQDLIFVLLLLQQN